MAPSYYYCIIIVMEKKLLHIDKFGLSYCILKSALSLLSLKRILLMMVVAFLTFLLHFLCFYFLYTGILQWLFGRLLCGIQYAYFHIDILSHPFLSPLFYFIFVCSCILSITNVVDFDQILRLVVVLVSTLIYIPFCAHCGCDN